MQFIILFVCTLAALLTSAAGNVARAPSPSGAYKKRSEPSAVAHHEKRSTAEQITLSKSAHAAEMDIFAQLCPDAMHACPMPSRVGLTPTVPATLADWIVKGYECVDTGSDLASCGGCASLEPRRDCMSIPHSLAVSCSAGACQIHSCKSGYTLAARGDRCVKSNTTRGLRK